MGREGRGVTIGRLDRESETYRRIREELEGAEIALRDQRERVAELRRKLPLDTEVEDYRFQEGPARLADDGPGREVGLSQLFERPDLPLVLYQFMFGNAQKSPCPMCTMWIDGLNGVAHHLRQRANFAVVAQASIDELRRWGRKRGWSNLRLLSSSPSTLKRDLGFEDAGGAQMPGVSVFVRAPGGLRHFYSVSAYLGGGEYRGIDLLCPVWHLLDLLPGGRGDWMPSLGYERNA